MFERLSSRLAGSILLFDVLLTLICLHVASVLRLWLEFGKSIFSHQVWLAWQVYLAVAIIWVIVFLLFSPHRALFTGSVLEAIGRLIAAVALAALAFSGMLYLSFRDVSRLQFVYFAASNFLTLLLLHLLVRGYIHSRQHRGWQRRVLLVGDEPTGQLLAQEFVRRTWAGIHVVGYTSNTPMAHTNVPLLGTIDDTVRLVVEQRIDEVIFTLPPQQQSLVIQQALQLQQQPVMLHMVPSVLDLAFARTPVETLGGIPLISLRESALSDSQRLFKRIFDIVASLVLLLLFAPLMLIIALLIKIESPGPVFFVQERIGEHRRRFNMFKFRSMYRDAEQRWLEVAQHDHTGRLIHKHWPDPRVTRVGHKLRRTSLDELPQLFNVLRGEMSLVGPRPEMPYITQEYEPWQWQRFRVTPGITGWWQVNGRSAKPMHLHTEDDLYYIQNYSFWLDLRILLKTVLVVCNGHGAY